MLLVPSFAIGRTQEIVWELDRLIERGKIPQLPLYLDSPMASKATDIYRRHPEYFDEETAGCCATARTPLDYPDQIVTNDVKAVAGDRQAPRPYMIVASNGMLTGGRVVGHLRNLIGDPTAVLLFVGYQGEGTLGRHLQAGAKTVRSTARSASPLPGPLDQRLLSPRRRAELLDWIGHFARASTPAIRAIPERVFLVHGDPTRRPPSSRRSRRSASHPHPALARAGDARLTSPASEPAGRIRAYFG